MIFGGLSASYFHEELIAYPQVDFVLRGDSTEPPLHELLVALRDGTPLDGIPEPDVEGWPARFASTRTPTCPPSLDYVDIATRTWSSR